MSNFNPDAANQGFLQKLQNVQIGGASKAKKIKKRDMIFMLRTIAILVENGLSLPRALETLVKEKTLDKYAHMLSDIKRRVESGESFSDALDQFPDAFDSIMVSQIRIGERSGTVPATLGRIMHQLEHADNLKGKILKKLTYPALLTTAGSGAVTFMLLYVVPTFESIYSDNGAELPGITQFLIAAGQFGTSYGWMILLALIGLVVGTVVTRRNPAGQLWMDTWLCKTPVLGTFFKNIAVLQFMEILGNLMDAGFTVVEALKVSATSVGNLAVRGRIQAMHEAVTQGRRFSDELDRHEDLFPPVVNQLVIVGEETGTLSKTTVHIREHLRREVEAYTNAMVGAIEPIMTAGLATVVGVILLAIYLPMFDMISAMNGGGGH